MANALISVIIPCYNVENYVTACVHSVLDNLSTYPELELICVNDGSTDGTLEELKTLAKEHSEITVITQKNAGLSQARNTGLKHSNGAYISFVDADDMIAPNFYARLVQEMNPYNASIVQCELAEFNDGDKPAYTKGKVKFFSSYVPDIVTSLPKYKMETVMQSNKLYSASIFFKTDTEKLTLKYPAGLLHEDEYIIADELIRAKRYVCISDKLYGYRRNREGSITNQMSFHRVNDMVTARTHAISTFETYRDVRCRTGVDFQHLADVINFEKTTLMNDFMYMYMALPEDEKKSDRCKELLSRMNKLRKEYFPATTKYLLFFKSPKLFEKVVKNKK